MGNQKEAVSDEFDDAWSEIVDNASADTAEETEPKEAEEEAEPVEDKADTESVDDKVEADPEASEEQAEIDFEAEIEKQRQKIRSAEGRERKLNESLEELRAQMAELQAKAGKEPEPEPESFIPEGWDKAEWLEYRKEFPDYAKEIATKAGQPSEQSKLDTRIEKTAEYVEELMADKKAAARESALAAFNAPIIAVHPDYLDIVSNRADDVLEWINSVEKPSLRRAYTEIYQGGDSSEVIDLVTDYKSARGLTKPGGLTPKAPRNPKAATTLKTKGAPRVNPAIGTDDMDDDFDAIWDRVVEGK